MRAEARFFGASGTFWCFRKVCQHLRGWVTARITRVTRLSLVNSAEVNLLALFFNRYKRSWRTAFVRESVRACRCFLASKLTCFITLAPFTSYPFTISLNGYSDPDGKQGQTAPVNIGMEYSTSTNSICKHLCQYPRGCFRGLCPYWSTCWNLQSTLTYLDIKPRSTLLNFCVSW